MNRRESREVSFCLLFEWSFRPETSLEELMQSAVEARDLECDEFSEKLTTLTLEHCDEFDRIIENYSQKWKINRLSRVTLSALRLALCELLYFNDIPTGATINEAVELVKKFGTDEDASYLNGILGGFQRAEDSVGSTEEVLAQENEV